MREITLIKKIHNLNQTMDKIEENENFNAREFHRLVKNINILLKKLTSAKKADVEIYNLTYYNKINRIKIRVNNYLKIKKISFKDIQNKTRNIAKENTFLFEKHKQTIKKTRKSKVNTVRSIEVRTMFPSYSNNLAHYINKTKKHLYKANTDKPILPDIELLLASRGLKNIFEIIRKEEKAKPYSKKRHRRYIELLKLYNKLHETHEMLNNNKNKILGVNTLKRRKELDRNLMEFNSVDLSNKKQIEKIFDAKLNERKKKYGINSELLRKLSNKKYAEEIDLNWGVSKIDLVAIKILSYEYSPPEDIPTEHEKKIVQNFLNHAQGNMKLNKQLKIMTQESLSGTGLSSIAIGNIIMYSFKTRKINDFNKSFYKLDNVFVQLQDNKKVANKDKISLSQYSNVYDVARISPILQEFKNKGFMEGNNKLSSLCENAEKSSIMIGKMENEYKHSYKHTPGRIAFDNTKRKSSVLGKSMSFFDNLIRKFITSHGHASKLYASAHNVKQMSHINPSPMDEDFKMRDYLYTDIFEIQLEKLISKNKQTILEKHYGDDWKEKINTIFKEVERDIHDNTNKKFMGIYSANDTEQYKAGVASMVPFGLGHKKFKKNDFEDIHRKVMNDFYISNNTELLCSEFVAHTTIASLFEVNKRLEEQLNTKLNFIKIPIGKHENLHRMHPDRLLKVLKKSKCIKKATLNESISKYFKQKKTISFSSKKKSHALTKINPRQTNKPKPEEAT